MLLRCTYTVLVFFDDPMPAMVVKWIVEAVDFHIMRFGILGQPPLDMRRLIYF